MHILEFPHFRRFYVSILFDAAFMCVIFIHLLPGVKYVFISCTNSLSFRNEGAIRELEKRECVCGRRNQTPRTKLAWWRELCVRALSSTYKLESN
jgi:hypothetical protein